MSIQKNQHRWHKRMASIGEKNWWINNLCDCDRCTASATLATGFFKRAINKIGRLDVYDDEEIPPTAEKVENDRAAKSLKEWFRKKEEEEKKLKENTYISSTGSIWTNIED